MSDKLSGVSSTTRMVGFAVKSIGHSSCDDWRVMIVAAKATIFLAVVPIAWLTYALVDEYQMSTCSAMNVSRWAASSMSRSVSAKRLAITLKRSCMARNVSQMSGSKC